MVSVCLCVCMGVRVRVLGRGRERERKKDQVCERVFKGDRERERERLEQKMVAQQNKFKKISVFCQGMFLFSFSS